MAESKYKIIFTDNRHDTRTFAVLLLVINFFLFTIHFSLVSFLFGLLASILIIFLSYIEKLKITPKNGYILLDAKTLFLEINSENILCGHVESAHLTFLTLYIRVRTLDNNKETVSFVASCMKEEDWKRLCRISFAVKQAE